MAEQKDLDILGEHDLTDLPTDKLKYKCKNCDPSTETHKYEWNEEYSQWGYLYTIMQCPTCNTDIPTLDYETLPFSCKHCDPSTKEEKYYWNEEYKIWERV